MAFVKDFSLAPAMNLGYPPCQFKVLLPGTYDPPTNGHLNILRRASRLFDAVQVVIAVNPSKSYLFDADERLSMMTELAHGMSNVSVSTWNGLIVDFADRIGVHVIVRGFARCGLRLRVRAVPDEQVPEPEDRDYFSCPPTRSTR